MRPGDWTALLLAGERPGENRFAASHGVAAKALIPVAGQPMLGRVARALLASPSIARIVILAQAPERLLDGPATWIGGEARIGLAQSGAGISGSIAAVAGTDPAPYPILVVTADHALLTPAMVETFIAATPGCDIAAGLVERRVVEAAYPDTRRTWLRFRDGDFSGANLFALRTSRAHKALEIWAEVERDRKKVLRLLLHFGPWLALRALTRTIGLDAALRAVGRRAGIDVRAVRLPYAEAAIDVDKPEDLELAERILAGRATSADEEQKEEPCASLEP